MIDGAQGICPDASQGLPGNWAGALLLAEFMKRRFLDFRQLI